MNLKRYDSALEDINMSLQQNPYVAKSYIRKITCIKKANKTEQFHEIPMCYLNALFSLQYQDRQTGSLCKEYVQFLQSNNAFKTNVQTVSSKRDLDRVLKINPDTLIVLDIFASWCKPCKVKYIVKNSLNCRTWLLFLTNSLFLTLL